MTIRACPSEWVRRTGGRYVRHKRPLWLFVVLSLALALVAAACGSDDNKGSNETTTTSSSDSGGSGSDFSLDESIKLVLLVENKGESPGAIQNWSDGWEMAIAEINAAGGVGGKPVEIERFPMSPTDVAQAKTAFRQGLDADPTIIVGFASSNVATALAADIGQSQLPVLSFFPDPSLYVGAPNSMNQGNLFLIRPNNATVGADIAEYAVGEKGYKKIALLCVDGPTGQVGCDTAAAAVEKSGGQVVARERHGTTDTDLTAQVQAVGSAGAEAVLAFPFPNQLGVFVNQLVQNGFKIPVLAGVSPGMMIDAGVINGANNLLMTGFDDCSPPADPRPDVQAWAKAYQDKYGYRPNWASAQAYDAAKFSAAAVEAAESTDSKAIIEAMRGLEYESMCSPMWKADAGQGLVHNQDILNWNEAGEPKLVQRNTLPPNP